MIVELCATACALAAVYWTAVRLPRFWRAPRPVDVRGLPMSEEHTARGLPALAVLGTPLVVLIAVIAWIQPDSDTDGVAPWLQDVVVAWGLVALGATFLVGLSGRPRFAVAPALRGHLRDAPIHDVTVTELRTLEGAVYWAECTCGWDTDHHDSEAAVRDEAAAHSSRVRPELERA